MTRLSAALVAGAVALTLAAGATARSKPDRVPPSIPTVAGPRTTESTTPTYVFSAHDRRTPAAKIRFRCGVDTYILHACGARVAPTFSVGPHVILVRAVDGAGNRSAVRTVRITISAPPANDPTPNPPDPTPPTAPATYDLTISTSGQGAVVVQPGGQRCTVTCVVTLATGTQVSLSVDAVEGSYAAGWGGDCAGTTSYGTCMLTMSTGHSVTAAFAPYSFTLTVSVAGPGRVTSDFGGIDCPGTCSLTTGFGAYRTLTATPDPGHTFSGWGPGLCQSYGTNPTCTVGMFGDTTVAAGFT